MTDFNIKLIELVKERPALWNKYHEYYQNHMYVNSVWTEIGVALKNPKNSITNKWSYIRRKYKKELLEKIIINKGTGLYHYTGDWQYFDKMSFMKEVFLNEKIKKMKELHELHINNHKLKEIVKISKTKESKMVKPLEKNSKDLNSDDSFKEIVTYKTEAEEIPPILDENSNYEINNLTTLVDESEEKPNISVVKPDTNIGEEKNSVVELIVDKNDCSQKRKKPIYNSNTETKYKKAMITAENFDENLADTHFALSLVPYLKRLNPLSKMLVRNDILRLLRKELLYNDCKYGYNQHPCNQHM